MDLTNPAIIPRSEHAVSRADIAENALKVLYRLKDAGYEAYLVGGGVRDLLLGQRPKDFDVATDAKPEQVKKLFRNCRLIGRRFRLAHILFGRDVIEVATFRAPHDPEGDSSDGHTRDGMIIRDNVYGNLEEDAFRRDFTINSLYYNIRDFSLVDHTGGLADLRSGIIRLIGDPEQRYREDPVRMLRAVRFAAKLRFSIEQETEQKIFELGHLLEDIPVARLYDEALKLLQGGYGVRCYELLRHYGLFKILFPYTEAAIEEDDGYTDRLIRKALKNTDDRIAAGKPVTPAFIFAALLWSPMRLYQQKFMQRGMPFIEALQNGGREAITRQTGHTAIPKRFSMVMREIWHMQPQLEKPTRRRAPRTLGNPKFRAGYDFLLLRTAVGETEYQAVADWWTRVQEVSASKQKTMLEALEKGSGKRKRRRRKPSRKKSAASSADAKSSD